MKDKIIACKLYKASSHKSDILAALDSPVNKQLVTQLTSYLDEEDLLDKIDVEVVKDDKTDDSKSSKKSSKNSSPSHTSFTPSHATGYLDLDEDLDKLEEEEAELDEAELDEAVDETEENEEVNSSIHASTDVDNTIIDNSTTYIDFKGLPATIKGILNIQADTAGVVRVAIKGDEVWVYYNDNTNLNNIMADVVELLNASNYSYLEFNRLARSDNAIVFQILGFDTNVKVDPTEKSDEE